MAKKNEDTILAAIIKFIESFPDLAEMKELFPVEVEAESLGSEAKAYVVETEPINPVVKKYLDGSGVFRYAFVFASRERFDRDTIENLKNNGFYEQFSDWIESCNKSGNLPELRQGLEAKDIKVTTTPYVFDTTATTARYQIQGVLTYYKEKEN
ncbi:MAG: hypothetical protein ACK5MN_12310 [Lachnospiraceae bacterium]